MERDSHRFWWWFDRFRTFHLSVSRLERRLVEKIEREDLRTMIDEHTWRFRRAFCFRSSMFLSERFFFNFFRSTCASCGNGRSTNSPPSGSLSESLELHARKEKKRISSHFLRRIVVYLDPSCSTIVSWHFVKISKQFETELIGTIESFVGSRWARKMWIGSRYHKAEIYQDELLVIGVREFYLYLIDEGYSSLYP